MLIKYISTTAKNYLDNTTLLSSIILINFASAKYQSMAKIQPYHMPIISRPPKVNDTVIKDDSNSLDHDYYMNRLAESIIPAPILQVPIHQNKTVSGLIKLKTWHSDQLHWKKSVNQGRTLIQINLRRWIHWILLHKILLAESQQHSKYLSLSWVSWSGVVH